MSLRNEQGIPAATTMSFETKLGARRFPFPFRGGGAGGRSGNGGDGVFQFQILSSNVTMHYEKQYA